jgi:uncharacterized membrane protein YdcZ (DUF606 family)
MRNRYNVACKWALVGGLLGACVVLRDMTLSSILLDPTEFILRSLGGAASAAVLGWFGGYAYGARRRNRKENYAEHMR